jgi:putative redox protein
MGQRENGGNSDPEPREVIVRGAASAFAQEIIVGRHRLAADEPNAVGGRDGGPTPYDLLLAGLGACTSMTIGLYARRKEWPLEAVTVRLRHGRIHAEDCERCETREGMIERIDVDVELTGSLDDALRARLIEIAQRCRVHRTLTSEIDIRTRAVGG